jgi:hypothetical protein
LRLKAPTGAAALRRAQIQTISMAKARFGPMHRPPWQLLFWLLVAGVTMAVVLLLKRTAAPPVPAVAEQPNTFTVADRLAQYGPTARARWAPHFRRAGLAYPPVSLVFAGLKDERILQIYAAGADGTAHFIRAFPILGASGNLGPKLREGDLQVPEGAYGIELLDPNSLFHLSLRINYPNAFDLALALAEGRTEPGCDIMIHGGDQSTGCLAIGDDAAEDMFILAADTGIERIEVLLCPVDLREYPVPESIDAPEWMQAVYAELRDRLRSLPSPPD